MTEPRQAPKAGRNLPAAIGVGLGLFAALAIGLIWFPWFFATFVAAALCLGAIEVYRALLRIGMRAEIVPIAIGTVASVLGGYVAARIDLHITPATLAVICLCATLIASLAARLFRGADGFIKDAAASALIIAYIPMLGVFVTLLMGAPSGTLRILTVLLCVIASDTGAYITGVLFGRHKLAPEISPSKTWEGFFGGIVFAAVLGSFAAAYLLDLHWWVGLPLGIFVSIAATIGDLVESLIKRDAGLKDMSNFLPGHGGIMDRLDSMLVAVPVGWLVLHLAMGS